MARSQDRISALPDELRAHILSFLPIEMAKETALLSKTWRYIWSSSLEELTIKIFQRPSDSMGFFNLCAGCPVLEDLRIIIDHIYSEGEMTFNITSSTLESLSIEVNLSDFVPDYRQHEFVVEAPELEYINIFDDALLFYELKSMLNLREAIVDVGCLLIKSEWTECKDQAGYAFGILDGITNTEILDLSGRTMAALSFSFDDNTLPEFPNLIHLSLEIHICFGWNLLMHLLEKSPNLETLDILKLADAGYDHDDDDDDDEVEAWDPPEQVPSCLSCIKEINIENIVGEGEDLEVVGYLLENATVLEKMVVRPHSDPWVQRCHEILQFPKASENCCKVSIDKRNSETCFSYMMRWYYFGDPSS